MIGAGATTRHLKTVWRREKAWHWKAVFVGHAQPRGTRNLWHDRRRWRFHLTPITAMRWGDQWAAGLCLGKRCIYLHSHR